MKRLQTLLPAPQTCTQFMAPSRRDSLLFVFYYSVLLCCLFSQRARAEIAHLCWSLNYTASFFCLFIFYSLFPGRCIQTRLFRGEGTLQEESALRLFYQVHGRVIEKCKKWSFNSLIYTDQKYFYSCAALKVYFYFTRVFSSSAICTFTSFWRA